MRKPTTRSSVNPAKLKIVHDENSELHGTAVKVLRELPGGAVIIEITEGPKFGETKQVSPLGLRPFLRLVS